jgi:hypothetical protein
MGDWSRRPPLDSIFSMRSTRAGIFRIRAIKQRGALIGRTILCRLVQLLDFSPTIRGQHAA